MPRARAGPDGCPAAAAPGPSALVRVHADPLLPAGLWLWPLNSQGDPALVELLNGENEEGKKTWKHGPLPKMSAAWGLEVSGREATVAWKVSGKQRPVTFDTHSSI